MTIALKEITIEQLKKFNTNELRHLCKKERLETVGPKQVLFKRLLVQKTGRSDKFTPARTKCVICFEPVKVVRTQRKELADGCILVTRQVRCTGRHRHTYPLKEIERSESNNDKS